MKTLVPWVAIALIAPTLVACGSSDKSSSGKGTPKSSDQHLTIGIAYAGLNQPFFAGFRKGAHDEADKLGVALREIDGKSDTQTQANGMTDLIAQQPDGLVLTPNDSKVGQSLVDKAAAAGIPIVAAAEMVGDPESRTIQDAYPKLAALVTQDEIHAGQEAGEIAVKHLDKGKVNKIALVEGQAGYPEVTERTEGFERALKDAGIDYQIVARQPGGWVRDKGKTVCQNVVASHPDVDFYFAHNDEMGVGCADALKAAGSKAKIVGIGGSSAGITAIERGTQFIGTICYRPGDMARLAIRTLVSRIRGQAEGQGKFITYPTPAITKSNVDECVPQW